jgi:hypothetical protein
MTFLYKTVFPNTEFPYQARIMEGEKVVGYVRFKVAGNQAIFQEAVTTTGGQYIDLGEMDIVLSAEDKQWDANAFGSSFNKD